MNVDIVFTGSLKRDKEYKKMGINSYFIPQFTRLEKFYPAYDEKYKSRLLFVGNNWSMEGVVRKTIQYSMNNNFELSIYGGGWDEILGEERKDWIKAIQVPNDELKYYYSSADIVFNDTREDMIEAGYISNRIFDATAAGAFVISDYIKEVEEIYGDSIVMYKNEQEFVELVNYYLEHPEERKQKAERAHKITVENFGAEKTIKKMADVMREYVKKVRK
jgi:spore maturation protein CgeB